jgi:hypothetical protein
MTYVGCLLFKSYFEVLCIRLEPCCIEEKELFIDNFSYIPTNIATLNLNKHSPTWGEAPLSICPLNKGQGHTWLTSLLYWFRYVHAFTNFVRLSIFLRQRTIIIMAKLPPNVSKMLVSRDFAVSEWRNCQLSICQICYMIYLIEVSNTGSWTIIFKSGY